MTYSSSLNSGSIVKVELRFEFGAQELVNDVFVAIVRRRENRLWYMANQTDGTQRDVSQSEPYHLCSGTHTCPFTYTAVPLKYCTELRIDSKRFRGGLRKNSPGSCGSATATTTHQHNNTTAHTRTRALRRCVASELLVDPSRTKRITMAPPPPQTYPYDHLFKILIIGDAGVGKVSGLDSR